MKLKRFFALLTGTVSLCVCALFGGCAPQETSRILWDLEIVSMPDKTHYIAGETFDATGMQVSAVYFEESTGADTRADVTSSVVVPDDPLEAGQTSVIIRYSEDGATQTEAVPVTVEEAQQPEPDHGTLTIEDMYLYNQFPSALLMISFSDPAYEEEISYSFDDWHLSIENNVARLVADVTSFTEVEVTATTQHHSAQFSVYLSPTFSDHDSYVPSRVSSIDNRQSAGLYEEGGVIFGGDSFFDIDFWSDFYTDYSGKNAALIGIGGSYAHEWLVYAESLFYPYAPSAVVLNIGTNDLGRGESTATVTQELQALFNRIHANLPEARICWYNITPRNDGVSITSIRSVNSAIAEWAQDKDWFTLLDAHSQFCNSSGSPEWGMFRDGLHPMLEQYDLVYSALLNGAGVTIPQLT